MSFDELAVQIRMAYQAHERSVDFDWKNGHRDDDQLRFALQYLADPTNPGTAEVLEAIDRARAGHPAGPVRLLVVVDERAEALHGITDDPDEARRWHTDLIARYGDPEAARVYPGVVDPDGLPVERDEAAVRRRVAELEAQAVAHAHLAGTGEEGDQHRVEAAFLLARADALSALIGPTGTECAA